MIKKFAPLAVLLILTYNAFAQTKETTKKTGRPDIPGTFVMDIGFNRLTERPNNVKYGLWGSRTLNLYYMYDMRIGKSKFTFHPGIGLGMERFKLLKYDKFLASDTIHYNTPPTLIFDNVGNTIFARTANYIYDADTLNQIDNSASFRTKKSSLAMNYLDVPIELRFNANPEDPARSFKVAIGGRAGYLLNAHTKIKYKEDGESKKLKNTQNYNLNRFRYTVYMKIYIGNFGFFGYYNLNPLFKEDKGPNKTQAQTYTVGITLSSF
jgi:hypothetical protein